MKKKLVLMTSALMAISLLSACNQHKHSFKEVAEVPATCTESGVKAYYTCEGCDKIFDADKKETTLDALKIAALGHDYQFNSFVWEGFTAQAKYVCSHDASHVELHDATVTAEVTKEATCESKGERTYTASYGDHSDTKTEEIAAGHRWSEVVYTWAEDNSTCTARRVCANDPTHVEEETAEAVVYVTISATCTTDGEATLIATFENKAFEDQTKEHVPTKAYGHNYQFDSFVWEGFTAQAKYVCLNDEKHIELHDATVTAEVTKEATCESKGERTYTASYDGHNDTKIEEIAAIGHSAVHVDAKVASCTEEGNIEHWHCNNCEKNFSDSECKNELKDVVIPVTHKLGTASYEWNESDKTCTAKATCEICEKEITETVQGVLGERASTDCYLYGLIASFETEGFESQIYDYYRFTLNNDNASYTVFKGNHLPSNVVIPEEINDLPVTRIGNKAFYETGIVTITIPKTVIVLEDYAVSDNDDLTSIVFEEGSQLERIERLGMYGNYSLKSISNLPASLVYIGNGGLQYNGRCTSITYLGTMEQWRAISKGSDWNEGTPACGAIHCSDGDVDDHYIEWDDWDDDDDL